MYQAINIETIAKERDIIDLINKKHNLSLNHVTVHAYPEDAIIKKYYNRFNVEAIATSPDHGQPLAIVKRGFATDDYNPEGMTAEWKSYWNQRWNDIIQRNSLTGEQIPDGLLERLYKYQRSLYTLCTKYVTSEEISKYPEMTEMFDFGDYVGGYIYSQNNWRQCRPEDFVVHIQDIPVKTKIYTDILSKLGDLEYMKIDMTSEDIVKLNDIKNEGRELYDAGFVGHALNWEYTDRRVIEHIASITVTNANTGEWKITLLDTIGLSYDSRLMPCKLQSMHTLYPV